MNTKLHKFFLSVFLTISYASFSISVQSANDLEEDNIQLEINDGMLSLQSDGAALDHVIRNIGQLAGFKTILADDFDKTALVNVSFENIAVEEAVERLIKNKNRIILYAKSSKETEKRIISQVWLLGSGDPSNANILNENQAISIIQGDTLSEENINDHKMGRLIKILKDSQQTKVRAMAASALGALENENAVSALQSVLLDRDSLVRSEAISALGRIGGQQAVMTLGNLLLNTAISVEERVNAAEALWQEGSGAANGYLSAGKLDEFDRVRLASSKPPSSLKSDSFSTLAVGAQVQ